MYAYNDHVIFIPKLVSSHSTWYRFFFKRLTPSPLCRRYQLKTLIICNTLQKIC